MATAYAALLSIMQIIDQIQNHPHPPISLDENQVESLTTNVTFLQEFLEGSNHVGYSKATDHALEMRIADAAHAVEDVMESHIVGQILGDGEGDVSVDFYEALQKAIDDMESIKKEAMNAQETGVNLHQQQLHGDSSAYVASSSLEQNRIVVGFDQILVSILDKLTWNQSTRQIISITGMGGIGKTTLVKSVFHHQLVEERFDFLAWVTISQEYEIKKILLNLHEGTRENLGELSDYELGEKLYRNLLGRRYLIIVDDIWNIDVWDGLNKFMPENNGSGIMITTRLANLSRQINSTHSVKMEFLDQDNSWKLFCKHVFGKEDCPLELEEIGKKIVEGCKGLPLSISVVGGLLSKSAQTREEWEHVAENLNSIVNLEDNEHCLQILYMSYNNLPAHLKPCFLYMGGFEGETHVMVLVASWVAEGFVRPIQGKSLEETAKEYLIDLIDRNLLLLDENSSSAGYWAFTRCILHDLLRDMCIREAQKQRFLSVVSDRSTNLIDSSTRRVTIVESAPEEGFHQIMETASPVRSLRSNKPWSPKMGFPLLRIALVKGIDDVNSMIRHVNLRLMCLKVPSQHRMPDSISEFWNLQTLFLGVLSSGLLMAPPEIWTMPQLRCIMGEHFYLPDTPADCNIVLENVHSIGIVHNFKCSEEVVKRIPNIETLMTCYEPVEGSSPLITDYCLENLAALQELQVLSLEFTFVMENLRIAFPLSLKVLALFSTSLHWDEVNSKIGSLPLLEYLRLDIYSCVGAEWETIEGHFNCLKSLLIFGCPDLEHWVTESSHFPRLERLVLHGFDKLEEIPPSIGDITTLQSIEVKKCSESVYDSAERIKEEQEEVGNEDLQVLVYRSTRAD